MWGRWERVGESEKEWERARYRVEGSVREWDRVEESGRECERE